MKFQSVSRTHVGLKRSLNEDALLARPDLGLWAVADGMGGHDAGEVASALVVELLDGCDAPAGVAGRIEAARKALLEANRELIALGQQGERQRTIGTTVVALAASGGAYACLWAGDSRAYLARDGVLSQLTKDHSLVQDLVDMGEITEDEAADHPNSNIVTRAVGADAGLRLDATAGEVLAGDSFLLASDGVTRVAGPEELSAALGAADLEAAADNLVDLCLERGAPDNLSFVMLRAED